MICEQTIAGKWIQVCCSWNTINHKTCADQKQSQNIRWSKSITKHALIKINHKTCADQNQSQHMRWSKSITKNALIKINHKTCADQKQSSKHALIKYQKNVLHNLTFMLLYDPTRINKARLSVLISGWFNSCQYQKLNSFRIKNTL